MSSNVNRGGRLEFTHVNPNKTVIATKNRNRRSFKYLANGFFTLSGWDENQFGKIRKYTEDHFNQTQKRIDSQGITIIKEYRALNDIALRLCMEELEVAKTIYAIEVQMAVLQMTLKVLKDMEEIRRGTLPFSISTNFLKDFCSLHFKQNADSRVCESPHLRELFKSSLQGAHYDTISNALIIDALIEAPQAEKRSYRNFQINTIPFFLKQVNPMMTKKLVTNLKYYSVLEGSPKGLGSIGFEAMQCTSKGDLLICMQKTFNQEVLCIQQITLRNSTAIEETCKYEESSTLVTCMAKRLSFGVLVSTKLPTEVHSKAPGQESIFSTQGVRKVGVFSLVNSNETVSTILCENRMFSTVDVVQLPEWDILDHQFDKNISVNWDPNFEEIDRDLASVGLAVAESSQNKFTKFVNSVKTSITWEKVAAHLFIAILIVAMTIVIRKIVQCTKQRKEKKSNTKIDLAEMIQLAEVI